ncbi:MAG: hypothetical protein B6241_10555 [Spirochaetaceae bacterium 4572_59]|nr:MAG: hypothetical protein B6241_10555 [Spirochaetaceae bacterium 4572_59]
MNLPEIRHYLFFLDKKILLEDGRTILIGRDESCEVHLDERTVSRRHAQISCEKDKVLLRDLGSTNGIQLNYRNVTEQSLTNEDRIIIGPFVLVYKSISEEGNNVTFSQSEEGILSETLALESKVASILQCIKDPSIRNQLFELKHLINRSKEKLSRLALVDRLTLLYNRRFFDDAIAREVERARRYTQELSLIMIDIDHFKDFNDTHGHQKGDEVLTEVAGIISDHIRLNDIASRYGGEEMVVILPESSLSKALVAAEKLRSAIEKESLLRTGLQVTVSLGVSEFTASENSVSDMISRADTALYKAKDAGRNRVYPENI